MFTRSSRLIGLGIAASLTLGIGTAYAFPTLLEEAEKYFDETCSRTFVFSRDAGLCFLHDQWELLSAELGELRDRVTTLEESSSGTAENPFVGTWHVLGAPTNVVGHAEYFTFHENGLVESASVDSDGIASCPSYVYHVLDSDSVFFFSIMAFDAEEDTLTLDPLTRDPVVLQRVGSIPGTHACNNVSVLFENDIALRDSRRVLTFGPDGLVATGPSDGIMYTINEANGTVTGDIDYTLPGKQHWLPSAWDGTQLWMTCLCGGNNEVISSTTGEELDIATIIGLPNHHFNIDGAAAEPGILYVSGYNYDLGLSQVHAIDTETKDVLWSRSFQPQLYDMTLDGNALLVIANSGRAIVTLRASDGSFVESHTLSNNLYAYGIEKTPTALWLRVYGPSSTMTTLQKIALP